MNIYIDESGSFVSTRDPESWCAVAAYVSPESDRKKVESLLRLLALRHNAGSREVKLKHLDEAAYFAFLIELGRLNGIVFSVATDMGYNSPDAVARHQSKQAQGIVAHREKMKYQPARDALTELGNTVREMTPQLYIQLSLQTILFEKVIRLATLYFVQRAPQTLREFRWRMDQKDHVPTTYEKAFRTVLPGLLQSRSFDEPMIFLDGCDYSYMSHYEYPKGQAPDYLHKQYGIPVFDGLNIGKIVAGNFQLVDSKSALGIQAADLVVSGIRRLLRSGFSDNRTAAKLLGQLTVQGGEGKHPVALFAFENASNRQTEITPWIRLIERHCRPMLISSRTA